MPLFQCAEKDFEGELSGAVSHCDLTGHTLTRKDNFGNVTRVELDRGDD